MVARQFRVLEAASSSPATSTKNMGRASLSPYFCLWCPNSRSSAQRNASALILQASASSSLVSRAQNYFAAGKAPATSKINPQVRNCHRFSLFFEHLNVFFNVLQLQVAFLKIFRSNLLIFIILFSIMISDISHFLKEVII